MNLSRWRHPLIATLLLAFSATFTAQAQQQAPTGNTPLDEAPANVLGNENDADIWRAVRQGRAGELSLPDENAATLIQSEGESWRAFRNGPYSRWAAIGMLGMLGLLCLFYAVRGPVRIEAGESGKRVTRFDSVGRFAHWLSATSFIILALTGINLVYGRYFLPPLLGDAAFAAVSQYGKLAHNLLSFSFIVGLVLMFVLWVKDNIPHPRDLNWLARAGGLLGFGGHPPAERFNAGQKAIFWIVILGGASVSLSGWALLFPFDYAMFAKTFAAINAVAGTTLPENLTPIQEMQLAQIWHGMVGFALTVVMIAHIYIGSIGMEGGFAAMGSGRVDENWAKEHHSLWYARMQREQAEHVDSVPTRAQDERGAPGQALPAGGDD